ncbi:phosphotransferase [Marinobacterium aestuariivivens]|uniref:Phosphotransferase n=1 Tax=Marinobacterium aestuariivivens TaxID=1698799 RepID=A0ABW2A6E0_9GAMM
MPSDIFTAVHRFLDAEYDWQPLGCGSSNRLYRADAAGQTLVLRVNAPPGLAQGVDRRREAQLLARLAGQVWAPVVHHCDPDAGWLLMDWHGETPARPLAAPLKRQLMQAVADWQQLEIDEGLAIDYRQLFDHYRRQLLGLPMSKALLQLIERLEQGHEALPKLPLTLTHHDLHHANLCAQDGRLVIVDWEYGAPGSPWFDAAALVREFGVTPRDVARLPAFAELGHQPLERGWPGPAG